MAGSSAMKFIQIFGMLIYSNSKKIGCDSIERFFTMTSEDKTTVMRNTNYKVELFLNHISQLLN